MTGRGLPLWPKIAWTAFIIVLVPIYWRAYGPTNFLWFSDIALFGLGLALWLESRFLVSTMSVGVLALEILWSLDFFTGARIIGLAGYMYDDQYPLWLRGFSLFHLAIPPLAVWMLYRLGYDRRALPAMTALAWLVLPATYLLSDPADNINWAFGPGEEPQETVPPLLYLAAVMLFLPLCVYLPTHLVLLRLFGRAEADAARP